MRREDAGHVACAMLRRASALVIVLRCYAQIKILTSAGFSPRLAPSEIVGNQGRGNQGLALHKHQGMQSSACSWFFLASAGPGKENCGKSILMAHKNSVLTRRNHACRLQPGLRASGPPNLVLVVVAIWSWEAIAVCAFPPTSPAGATGKDLSAAL